jgi:hypothetical protein
MFDEDIPQSGSHCLKWRIGAESEQDDAGVRLTFNEDQPAKVTIVGNEDATFPVGDREDDRIGLADREVADDRLDVVP